MRVILPVATCVLLLIAGDIHARLGETLTQARERYGWETNSVQNAEVGINYTSFHEKEGITIELRFVERGPGETAAVELIYTKTDGSAFQPNELFHLVGVNAQGRTWQDPTDKNNKITWIRDDGARAIYDKWRKTLTISTPERLKQRAKPPPTLRGF